MNTDFFTSDRAAQSVDYWRSTTQTLLADPEAANSTCTLRAYSHDVNSMANLLAPHNFTSQAEETCRLASQIVPDNPEAVSGVANVLAQARRATEACRLLDDSARRYPGDGKELEKSALRLSRRARPQQLRSECAKSILGPNQKSLPL